jgi:hypothetical protein
MPRSNNIIPHLSIRESFRDRQSVLNNGLVITGSPNIDNGYTASSGNLISIPQEHILFDENAFSISIEFDLPTKTAFGGTKRIWAESGNWALYLYETSDLIYLRSSINAASQFTQISVVGLYGTRLKLSCVLSESGGNITQTIYLNDTLSASNVDAGTMDQIGSNIFLGSDSGGGAIFPTTFYNFYYFRGYALSQEDHIELYDGTLSSDIQPFQSRIFLPGEREYVNTSGDKVTPIIGTSGVTEAVIGDGTTSTTFPTLGVDRLWTFDGGDYINLGDNDNFSFTKSDPITIGCLLSISDLTATKGIFAKGRSNLTTGEFVLYMAGSRFRFTAIDDDANAFIIIRSSVITNYLMNDELFSIIISYDGSGTFDTTTTTIYINTIDETFDTVTSGVFVDIENTSENLIVGGTSEPGLLMSGKLGFPFMISQELSPLQVQMIHDNMMRWRTM